MRAVNIEVYLASTYPCARPENIAGFYLMPVAFSNFTRRSDTTPAASPNTAPPANTKQGLIARFRGRFMQARYILGPLTLPFYGFKLNRVIRKVRPDAVHALRIPFEGMLAAQTPASVPLAVSIWGNDLTLPG